MKIYDDEETVVSKRQSSSIEEELEPQSFPTDQKPELSVFLPV